MNIVESISELQSSCAIDYSFPYHRPETAAERLDAIGRYMTARGFDIECFSSGGALPKLESTLAELFGMEAALWCPTGTLAQGIAARIHSDASGSRRLQLHPTSHLLLHEMDGYRLAHRLDAEVTGEWNDPLTATDMQEEGACLFAELPQRHSGGVLPTWDELCALKNKALETGVRLHVDGARIWSVRRHFGDREFREIASGFDSLYVSFYKDIGAIGGAALLGDNAFIAEAEQWRTRFGGLLVHPWPMVCDALRLLSVRLEQMPGFVDKARILATAVIDIDGVSLRPTLPHTNMFHIDLPFDREVAERARAEVAARRSTWVGNRFWPIEADNRCALEVIVGEKLMDVSAEDFVDTVELLVAAGAEQTTP